MRPLSYQARIKVVVTAVACFSLTDITQNINISLKDFTLRKVGLKELLTLKCHRRFNTRQPWPAADLMSGAIWQKAAPRMAHIERLLEARYPH